MPGSAAAGRVPLPEPGALRELLAQLSGHAVGAQRAAARLEPGPTVQAATYLGREGEMLALCLCEIELAAYLGAALAVLPQRVAKQIADTGRLEGPAEQGYRETMNVLASLLCSDTTPHLRFAESFPDPKAAGAAALALLSGPARRADYRVEIGGFGAGALALLAGS